MIGRSKKRFEQTFEQVLIYEDGAELGIERNYLEAIIKGEKRSTVRDKVRVFPKPCNVFLRFSSDCPPLKVAVENVEVKRLKDLTDEDAVADGFHTRDALVAGLRRYYPLLGDNSIVTIIYFREGASSVQNVKSKIIRSRTTR